MSILSLYPCNNSIEAGFDMIGYDIVTKTDNAIGVIGDNVKRVTKAVKALQPLFFVVTLPKNKYIDIPGYIATIHITTPEMYACSRNIVWIIGIKDNNAFRVPVLFPETDYDIALAVEDPDTLLTVNIAAAISDAIDANAVMSEYDKFYGFSGFNCCLP